MGFGPGGDLQRAFLSLGVYVSLFQPRSSRSPLFYFIVKEIIMISFRIITQKPKTAIEAPKASSGELF